MNKIITNELMTQNDNHRNKYEDNQQYFFADRLNYIMSVKNVTNVQLANILYCGTSTIASYRTGARIPNAIAIKEICRTLNVSADYLLGLSDSI